MIVSDSIRAGLRIAETIQHLDFWKLLRVLLEATVMFEPGPDVNFQYCTDAGASSPGWLTD